MEVLTNTSKTTRIAGNGEGLHLSNGSSFYRTQNLHISFCGTKPKNRKKEMANTKKWDGKHTTTREKGCPAGPLSLYNYGSLSPPLGRHLQKKKGRENRATKPHFSRLARQEEATRRPSVVMNLQAAPE